MVADCYTDNRQHPIEDVLSEATVSLAIVYKHLLHDFLSCHTAKAARFGPGFINDTVACHTIGR